MKENSIFTSSPCRANKVPPSVCLCHQVWMDGWTDGGWRDGGRREDGRGREGKEAGVTPASPSVSLPVIPGLRALDQRRRWLLVARQQSDGELVVSNSPSDTFKWAVCSSQLHSDIAELLASAGPNPRRAVGGQSGSNDAASRHRATNTGSTPATPPTSSNI